MLKPENKEQNLTTIINSIFKLNSPKIGEERKNQITEFIVSAVNGDNPIDYLALNANLGDNKKGVIVYILTNLRLIKIDIGTEPNDIQSSSFYLSTIIGVERKMIDNDRTQFNIAFQNGNFGLRYSIADKSITEFFQKIDQPR